MCDIASTSLTVRPAAYVREVIPGMSDVVVAGRISRCDVVEDEGRDEHDDDALTTYNWSDGDLQQST